MLGKQFSGKWWQNADCIHERVVSIRTVHLNELIQSIFWVQTT